MLQITSTYTKMELTTHWPRAEIEQKVAQLQVQTTGPEIEIDQLQCRNELGIGGFDHYSDKAFNVAYQKTVEAIAKMVAEGDEVVQRGGHFREEMIFADQARRAMDAKIPEINIGVAPSSRPKINFNYQQEIDWNQGGVNITHRIRPPDITWIQGGVKVDVRG